MFLPSGIYSSRDPMMSVFGSTYGSNTQVSTPATLPELVPSTSHTPHTQARQTLSMRTSIGVQSSQPSEPATSRAVNTPTSSTLTERHGSSSLTSYESGIVGAAATLCVLGGILWCLRRRWKERLARLIADGGSVRCAHGASVLHHYASIPATLTMVLVRTRSEH